MSTLEKIVDYKRLELEHIKRRVPIKDLQKRARDAATAQNLVGHFADGGINIIAEFKRKSPSAGGLCQKNPVDVCLSYQDNGAKAVSILTDDHFFGGSLDDLSAVKVKLKIPVLRKDFTLEEYHLIEARAHGADAILLIAAILDDYQIRDYDQLARELGLTALLETHNEEELQRILKIHPKLIGINNRNLKTLKTDLATTENLYKLCPKGALVISESGLNTHDQLVKFKEKGIAGFLIGETLLKSKDPGDKLREMLGHCER